MIVSCHRRKQSTRNLSAAFTLIELLVVIAIISILAAILFPVFARARENARRASCSSNLKQIGLGLLQYAQDYDEKMAYQQNDGAAGNVPQVSNYATSALMNWMAGVQPYVKSWQLFRCPSAPESWWIAACGAPCAAAAPNGNSDSTYLLNGVVMGRSLAVIPKVSEIIWCHDYNGRGSEAVIRPYFDPSGSKMYAYGDNLYHQWIKPYNEDYAFDSSHFDGSNLLFCDGHVKWRRKDSIAASDFGLTSTSVGPVPGATGSAAAF